MGWPFIWNDAECRFSPCSRASWKSARLVVTPDPGVLGYAGMCPRAASGDAVNPVLHTATFFEAAL
jgi:hypothetical protein